VLALSLPYGHDHPGSGEDLERVVGLPPAEGGTIDLSPSLAVLAEAPEDRHGAACLIEVDQASGDEARAACEKPPRAAEPGAAVITDATASAS
jgi:hypothetical protein